MLKHLLAFKTSVSRTLLENHVSTKATISALEASMKEHSSSALGKMLFILVNKTVIRLVAKVRPLLLEECYDEADGVPALVLLATFSLLADEGRDCGVVLLERGLLLAVPI